nr:MAG TPA: hypothetical protein [Caudoviricetes sp.]
MRIQVTFECLLKPYVLVSFPRISLHVTLMPS